MDSPLAFPLLVSTYGVRKAGLYGHMVLAYEGAGLLSRVCRLENGRAATERKAADSGEWLR